MKFFDYKKEDAEKTIKMAWPAMMETFFTSFTSLVDSLMVSTLGSYAVAAVGLTTQPKLIGLALFMASNVAVSAVIARRKGENRREEANRVFLTFFLFTLITACIISVLVVAFADPIIALCGSKEATHDGAVEYFRIIMGCMIFQIIQMGINAAQRGCGNTKIAMRTNLVSNSVNIVLNYLLIGGHFGFPALGIKGAAIATVLGTVTGCVMSIITVFRRDSYVNLFYICKERILPAWDSMKSIMKVGYGVLLEQILMRAGFMATAVMAANQGTDAFAAHQVGMNILSLSFSFGDGLQSTAIALIGYSLGAKEPKQAKEYGRTCQLIGGCVSAILAVIFLVFGKGLLGLFFEEAEIIEIGLILLKVAIVVIIFQISAVTYMGCLRGAGDTLYTAVASTISITIVRTFISWFCCYILNWGIVGIWMGIWADSVGRLIFGSIRFKSEKWMKIKV